MNLMMSTPEQADLGKMLEVPAGARILIVCDNDSERERLKTKFPKEKFVSKWVRSMAKGCEAAKSGRFQVIISSPLLRDGSWRRLINIAKHYDRCFEVILWARNFDLAEWAKALNDGAFDVLDAVREQARVVEVIKGAIWAAYLKGARPDPRAMNPRKVA